MEQWTGDWGVRAGIRRWPIWLAVWSAVWAGWCVPRPAGAVEVGSTRAELTAAFGEPEFAYRRGGDEILTYLGLEVRLRDGRVVEMPYRMAERIQKRDDLRREKLAEQTRQSRVRRVAVKRDERRPVPMAGGSSVRAAQASGGGPTVVADGGREVDLRRYIGKGRVTVVDFYADWCGPCRQVAPHLEQLARSDPDVDVVKIDIVRWGTPVAEQYGIQSIPSMRVYNRRGDPVGKPTASLSEVMARVKRAK